MSQRSPARPALLPLLAPLAATLAVTAGLHPVLQGGRWFVDAAAGAAVVTAVALATRGLGRPWGRVPGRTAVLLRVLLQVGALAVLLTWLYAPAQGVLGLVPGPAALERLEALVAAGREAVRTQTAPAPSSPPLMVLVTGGAGLLTLVLDLLAVRARRAALAGLPLLVVHGIAVVLAPVGLAWGAFALAAVGYAVLLASAAPPPAAWGRVVRARAGAGLRAGRPWPGRSTAVLPTSTVVVAALAGAVVLPLLVPGAGPGFFRSGPGGGAAGASANAINPLIDLRSDLRSRSDATVLRYTTDVDAPQPLRIVTIDAFDGQVWRPSSDRSTLRPLEGDLPVAPGLGPSIATRAERADIEIVGLRQQWLPLPYPATSIDVDGRWTYDERTLNVAGVGSTSTSAGQRYRVDYLQVAPSAAQLAATAAPPESIVATYGKLPDGLPPSIARTAREVAGAAQGEYAQAVALQTWFRTDGGFVYSTRSPAPHSASALADFLRAKRGYCVHFASAMAVMARSLGIPARVAVGFLPGTQGSNGRWSVSLQDAHAWPELYFTGVGWVRFEPTPGERSGVAPDWTVPAAVTAPTTPGAEAGATTTTPGQAPAPVPAQRDTPAAEVGAQGSEDTSTLWVPLAATGAALLAVLVLPALGRVVGRRRRWARARAGLVPAGEAAWEDLVEQLADLGVGVPASATARQVAVRLAGTADGPADGPADGARASAVDRTAGRMARCGDGAAGVGGGDGPLRAGHDDDGPPTGRGARPRWRRGAGAPGHAGAPRARRRRARPGPRRRLGGRRGGGVPVGRGAVEVAPGARVGAAPPGRPRAGWRRHGRDGVGQGVAVPAAPVEPRCTHRAAVHSCSRAERARIAAGGGSTCATRLHGCSGGGAAAGGERWVRTSRCRGGAPTAVPGAA